MNAMTEPLPPSVVTAPLGRRLGACSEIRARDATLFVLLIAVGLWADQMFELWGQIVTSIACWVVILAFMHRTRGDMRATVLVCLALMTAAEIFASLIWGLYLYRLHNIPPFIPPGHAMMLLVALFLGARLGTWVLFAAPAVALACAGYAMWTGTDSLSIVLTPVFIAGMWLARDRKLYAITFLLALALELYGTWVGNWRWEERMPWFGFSMANPPLCIGALYCVRDVLIGIILNVMRRMQRVPVPVFEAPPHTLLPQNAAAPLHSTRAYQQLAEAAVRSPQNVRETEKTAVVPQ